ncbi:MAG: VCBS repeat-containing protein, partial [Verrucomicrobiota bacterium]
VSTRKTNGPLLVDCTASALRGNEAWQDQILRGLNYWMERMEDNGDTYYEGHSGLAVGDVNGDGLDDVYLAQERGLPNRLFLQNPDGTVRDASAEAGVDWLDESHGVLLVDLDNDADQDLVITIPQGVLLAANDGTGRFQMKTVLEAAITPLSLCAADYDADGRLDIYVCGYSDPLTSEGGMGPVIDVEQFVYHDSNSGAPNRLFRNRIGEDGSWAFDDVTAAVGLDRNNRRYSFVAVWEDVDNDGDQDLYVANDYGRNNLYRNDGGTFVDIAGPARAEDSASGMGVTWGDIDRDGHMDLYVANMYSTAGSRITRQAGFKQDASEEVRARLRRFSKGNTLLRNVGDSTFEDVSEAAGVTMGRWSWSANFADLNNDGWEDLIVANGFISGTDSGDL